jgi:hypothetical protein
MRLMTKTLLALPLLVALVAGCGGGSDNSSTTSSQPKGKVVVHSDTPQFAKVRKSTFRMTGTVDPADADVTVDGLTADVRPEGETGRWTSLVRLSGFGTSSIRVEGKKAGYTTGTVDTAVIRVRSPKERAAARARAQARRARARAAAAKSRAANAARRARENAPVSVPSEVGERLDLAKRDVRGAGLSPVAIDAEGTTFGIILDQDWTVCSTTPAAGASVKKGTRVHLYAKKHGC